MTEPSRFQGRIGRSPWDSTASTAVRTGKPRNFTEAAERTRAIHSLLGTRRVVYAIRLPSGLIKIGCSANLAQRRRQLRGDILAFNVGEYEDEQAIHDKLVPHVHHGREWYNPTPEVISVVNRMRTRIGLHPIDH